MPCTAARALTARGIKMLVVACNTASAVALPALTEALAPLPVIGVIEPGAEAALAAPEGPIAVIATEGTVKGGAYVRAIQAIAPDLPVVQQACAAVRAAGGGRLARRAKSRELAAHRYLDPLLATMPHPRGLVLGCTHFPALKQTIAQVAGPDVTLVDSAETTARRVEAKFSTRWNC